MSGRPLSDLAPGAASLRGRPPGVDETASLQERLPEATFAGGRAVGAAGAPTTSPAPASSHGAAVVTFAVYGKLPQRRDFVSHAMPHALLAPFETFLSAGMGQARQDLGEGLLADYLVMPTWRFWIGSACCGHAALGALVPSVDGIGRHFPLAILAVAPEGRRFEHPLIDPAHPVFEAIEARLLTALGAETGAPFDAAAIAAGLEPPQLQPIATGTGGPGDVVEPSDEVGSTALDAFLQGACREDHRRLAAGMSYFWTAGHGGQRPALFARSGLPAPADFTAMVRGLAPRGPLPGEPEFPS